MTINNPTKKIIKNKKVIDDFLENFGHRSIDDLVPVLIENYLEAIDFISIHKLDDDFIFFVDNKKLYRQLIKSRFLSHSQHKNQKEN